jgi:hypothetical protein
VEYEKVREPMRASIIALKQRRRVPLGENMTLLFENRQTVLYQIQEMVRSERIVLAAKIQEEIDAYAPLLPGPGQLSATLFIELPGIATLPPEQARAAVNRFQGIERGCLFLELGGLRIAAHFEAGHSNEEKLAAVQYVRFALPPAERQALADPARPALLLVEHPNYSARQALADDLRRELLDDIADHSRMG